MCIAGKVTDGNFINSNLIEKSIFSLFFCNLNAGAVKCQLPKKHSLKDQQFSRIGESYNLKKIFSYMINFIEHVINSREFSLLFVIIIFMKASDTSSSAIWYFHTIVSPSSSGLCMILLKHRLVVFFFKMYLLNVCHIVYKLVLVRICKWIGRDIPENSYGHIRKWLNQFRVFFCCGQARGASILHILSWKIQGYIKWFFINIM